MAIKVRALAPGHYGNRYREAGDEFQITEEKHFSKRWMEKVGEEAEKPESKTKAPEPEKSGKGKSVI